MILQTSESRESSPFLICCTRVFVLSSILLGLSQTCSSQNSLTPSPHFPCPLLFIDEHKRHLVHSLTSSPELKLTQQAVGSPQLTVVLASYGLSDVTPRCAPHTLLCVDPAINTDQTVACRFQIPHLSRSGKMLSCLSETRTLFCQSRVTPGVTFTSYA